MNEDTFEQQNLVFVLQFTLKMTLLDFQLTIIITVTIQVAVLKQFSWNSNNWCGSTHGQTLFFIYLFNFLKTIGPIEPQIGGKMCPQKLVFWLSLSRYGVFLGKNIKAIFVTPLSIEKVTFIFAVWSPIPYKIVTLPKNYFSQLFWKILFCFCFLFWKKLLNEKYSKPHFLQKSLYKCSNQRRPSKHSKCSKQNQKMVLYCTQTGCALPLHKSSLLTTNGKLSECACAFCMLHLAVFAT